ncbi:dihydrodipicolinate synthase family protein [Vibrio nomapromontoriensis]|uniref:dihydrodipicolinate synthase family protein n=1 Tax=Vibrio nomapromontoriensis TaxID=2910246 RepID=UPI003D14EF5F
MNTNCLISGNWATLLLPIHDESIDFEKLSTQIEYYIAAGVDGIYSNGTAGEFYTQTESEFQAVNCLLAEKCHQHDMPFQVGACHCHPQEALERVKFASSLTPTAIQVILPDWFPCSLDVAMVFMKAAEQAANGVSLVLYNPPHAKVRLSANELVDLYDNIHSLVGFKLPRITPDIEKSGLAKRASIFVAGHFLATDAYKGAKGAYSNVCCLNPKSAQKWTDDCLKLKPAALELEARIQQYMAQEIAPYITEQGYCNAAVDKFMATLGGWSNLESTMRFPFASIPKSDIADKLIVMGELLPEFRSQY